MIEQNLYIISIERDHTKVSKLKVQFRTFERKNRRGTGKRYFSIFSTLSHRNNCKKSVLLNKIPSNFQFMQRKKEEKYGK